MARPTYFVQDCPTCGRHLQVRVEYLGKSLICRHCRGTFQALDPSSGSAPQVGSSHPLVQRADELLDSVSDLRRWPR